MTGIKNEEKYGRKENRNKRKCAEYTQKKQLNFFDKCCIGCQEFKKTKSS